MAASSANPFDVGNTFTRNSDPWNPNSGFGNTNAGFGNIWNAPSAAAAVNKPTSLFEVSPLPTFSKLLQENEKSRNPFDGNDAGVTRISRTRSDSFKYVEDQDEYEPPPKLAADDFQRLYRRDLDDRDDDDGLQSAVIDYGHGASNDIPDDDDMLKYVRREEAADDDDDDDRVRDCVTIDYGHGAAMGNLDTEFDIPPMDDDIPPHPSKHCVICLLERMEHRHTVELVI